MNVFGTLSPETLAELRELLVGQAGLEVQRRAPARSSVPHPQSTDLELALKPHLEAAGFQHHVRLEHPRTGEGFEYDFWRPSDGIAIEVMGYKISSRHAAQRADVSGVPGTDEFLQSNDEVRTFAERQGYDLVITDDRGCTIPPNLGGPDLENAILSRRVVYARDATDITDSLAPELHNTFRTSTSGG